MKNTVFLSRFTEPFKSLKEWGPPTRRILGGDEFVQRLLREAEEREKETMRLTRKVPDLATLVRRFAEAGGIEDSVLRSDMRGRKILKVRRMFCQMAVQKMGYPGVEVARFLGVTISSVNQLAVSEEEAGVEETS